MGNRAAELNPEIQVHFQRPLGFFLLWLGQSSFKSWQALGPTQPSIQWICAFTGAKATRL